MSERWKQEVRRAQIKQQIRHDEKFIANALDVKRRKILVSLPVEDRTGWAVYYYPSTKDSPKDVWLVFVGVNGVIHGEPVVFDNAVEAITHAASGEWATLV